MSLSTLGSGKNKYLCTYKGKKVEVLADTQLEARDLAAKHFQARKPYDVEAYLVELAGKPYAQTTMFASDRSSLIRLASALPKGSLERKAILSAITDNSLVSERKPADFRLASKKVAMDAKGATKKLLSLFASDNGFDDVADLNEAYPNLEKSVSAALGKMISSGANLTVDDLDEIASGEADFEEFEEFEGFKDLVKALDSVLS